MNKQLDIYPFKSEAAKKRYLERYDERSSAYTTVMSWWE